MQASRRRNSPWRRRLWRPRRPQTRNAESCSARRRPSRGSIGRRFCGARTTSMCSRALAARRLRFIALVTERRGHRAPATEPRAPTTQPVRARAGVTDAVRLGPHAGLRVARGLSCGRGDVTSGFAGRCAEVRALRGEERGLWGWMSLSGARWGPGGASVGAGRGGPCGFSTSYPLLGRGGPLAAHLRVRGPTSARPSWRKRGRGRYGESVARELSEARLHRHFVEDEGGYRIRRDVRDLCVFARHDVTQDPPFSAMDLVGPRAGDRQGGGLGRRERLGVACRRRSRGSARRSAGPTEDSGTRPTKCDSLATRTWPPFAGCI
jgi:hypothetical protein